MTKEGIKAVRFCCGYNTNLRVKLPYNRAADTAWSAAIKTFLMDNLLGVFGPNVYEKAGCIVNPQPGKDAADYLKLLEFIDEQTCQICLGKAKD